MNKFKQLLKEEFVNGMKTFDWCFLAFGLLLQVVAIILAATISSLHDDYLAITAISGITGVISVVLCSRGKISQYFFGYIQLFTYLFGVAIPCGLGGETAENIVYAVTMIIGIFIWIKRYRRKDEETTVETKNMTSFSWAITSAATVISILLFAMLLKFVPSVNIWLTGSENPAPFLDSVTTIVPLAGQMLMVFGYSDQWIFWFIEDVMSLVMFIVLGNGIMIAQYIFWTANCVYGYLNWRKLSVKTVDKCEVV